MFSSRALLFEIQSFPGVMKSDLNRWLSGTFTFSRETHLPCERVGSKVSPCLADLELKSPKLGKVLHKLSSPLHLKPCQLFLGIICNNSLLMITENASYNKLFSVHKTCIQYPQINASKWPERKKRRLFQDSYFVILIISIILDAHLMPR